MEQDRSKGVVRLEYATPASHLKSLMQAQPLVGENAFKWMFWRLSLLVGLVLGLIALVLVWLRW